MSDEDHDTPPNQADEFDSELREHVSIDDASNEECENYYPVNYSITNYGADYPVDALVKRINADAIYIPAFQRGYVWNQHKASRFIESLLLGLPVPAIFLSKEVDSSRLLVIDGQQRLKTLQYFYSGVFAPKEKLFKLLGVENRFSGKTIDTLSPDDRLRLDDCIIHAIIIKQDNQDETGTSTGAPSSAYHIFERLNTGGVLLTPQEIRSCVYHGPLIELLSALNNDPHWRTVFGPPSPRMRDRELILRFLALRTSKTVYSRPLKEYLNRFCAEKRAVSKNDAECLGDLFASAIRVVSQSIGPRAFRLGNAINAAVFDSVMVAVSRRLERGPITALASLKAEYDILIEDKDFRAAVGAETTSETHVKSRMDMATHRLGGVP